MKITYFGTTMLLFDDGTDQILFDCHVTRPSIKTCLRGMIDSDSKLVDRVINEFDINRLRGIFISHSHYDHILDAPAFALKSNCDVYGTSSSMNILLGNGVERGRIHTFLLNERFCIGEFKIRIIPSKHSEPHWYNDDIGQIVDEPFSFPAPKKEFKEGGSFDFLVTYKNKNYLIRPSYNYIENQLDNIKADVLFLGIGGMSRDSTERHDKFFEETIGKVHPRLVIPIHWDNFFKPLYGDIRGMPIKFENTGKAMRLISEYCKKYKTDCLVQLPLTSINL